MSIVRVHVAASHKFCVHCRDIRISEREKDGVELDTGNAENVYRVHIKKRPLYVRGGSAGLRGLAWEN